MEIGVAHDSSASDYVLNLKLIVRFIECSDLKETLNTLDMVPGFWHQGPEFLIVGFTWVEVFYSGFSSRF